MKHFIISLLLIIALTTMANAQMNVGSNNAPDNSAMLQISGNTKGFLPPRMNRDSMYLISNPARGLIVFNTSDSMLYLHRDSGWVALSAGEQQWYKNGSNIYNINSGNIGIGTSLPTSALHVNGTNPLTLTGVQAGTSTASDSLLTITNGLVRKIPIATFGSGSVSSVSVANANGLNGSVADANTTPVITLRTTVNGIVKGNGTALSAAAAGTDYAPSTAANTTGIVKSTTGTGALTTAAASDFPTLNQNTTGTAANITGTLSAASFPALSGDVTTTAGSLTTTIGNGKVTNAKLATVATQTFKGRTTAGTGAPEDLSATQATAMLNTFGTTKGLVPGTTSNTTSFLRADGTFAVPPGTNTNVGTVTSTSVVSANGLAGTVANPTTTPAITLTTTVTGIVKGDGTALSAATSGTDYAPGTSGNTTGIVKSTTGTGALTTAAASDFPTLNQNTTGTAANITGVLNTTSHPALIGDVTTPSGSVATTITNSAVTNVKLANMAANSFKANNTGTAAAPTDITGTQATALLDVFTPTAKGLVPVSGGGTTSFLRADGTFATPPGTNTNTGTITSVSVTSANGLSGTVATPTTTPAITLSTNVTGIIKGDGAGLSAAAAADFPILNQNTTGNAATVTTNANLTGDVTSIGNASTIATGVVTNTKLANMATQTLKGRTTAGTGAAEDLTATQATAILNPFTSALKGLVPASGGGTTSFLRADGTFAIPSGTTNGTVTSTSVVSANGMAGTVANPTTTPAITLTTTVNGMVKGNGTALSAATSGTDYAPGTAGNTTGIVKSTTGTGALTTANASDFPTLNQNTTGTAANITGVLNTTSHPALTGDVTTPSGSVATTISNSAVTNAKMANMAANSFKANNTGTAAAPTDITGTQATALLDVFTSTAKGLVPVSGGGTTSFLRADGTFATPPGTNTNAGTVTSVAVTTANGVSGTVANPTTTPAISLTLGNITPSSVAATGTVTGSNLSGTNTGDETNATIKTKLGAASATNDGYLTQSDWNTFNNKATTANTWSLLGNAGTSPVNTFLGTTDNISLRFRSNNTQRLLIDSLGNVGVGTNPTFSASPNAEKFLVDAGSAANPSTSYNVITGKGYINNYLQLNIQNKSAGAAASSDVVATADNGDETTNYMDMGINSSGYGGGFFGSANDAYLYNVGQNMLIGTSTANKSVVFMTGGGAQSTNERMRIDGSGNVGIGTTLPTSALHINATNPLTLTGVQTGTNTASDSLLTITSGVVKKLPLSGIATSGNSWSTTGNTGTTAGTNFIGTNDAQDFVLKANATERFRIVNGTSTETGTAGDIKIGDATSGAIRSTKELVMRQDGDQYGQTTLRLRNRNAENGAIFETVGASAALVDFIYRTGPAAAPITSNIRFETRSGSSMKIASNSTEWQFGQPDDQNGGPTLVVGAFGTGSNSAFRIGSVSIGNFVPTAALHLKAGTATASTAPLKFTAGTNLTTVENGAVEYNGTNYFVTAGATRYTLAKTLTNTATLSFGSVAGNSSGSGSSDITVTGAAVGDAVVLGIPTADGTINGSFTAFVSAANTVTVRYHNNTTAAITPTTGTFRVSVLKY